MYFPEQDYCISNANENGSSEMPVELVSCEVHVILTCISEMAKKIVIYVRKRVCCWSKFQHFLLFVFKVLRLT